MVVLASAANRDVRQVFVGHVDADRVRPVAETFHILETQVVPARAVILAERSTSARLTRRGNQLATGADVAELGVRSAAVRVHQEVDRRALAPKRGRHIVRAVARARPTVFPVVPGIFEVVFLAVGG